MTARELIALASSYPWLLVAFFVVLPIVGYLAARSAERGPTGIGSVRYFLSLLVYAACIPGVVAVVLTSYSLFFARDNLLDVNLLVYILPVISMVATLVAIHRSVSFDEIPGFDRLSGLMTMMATTAVIVLIISKTRIWIVFAGSLIWFVALAIGLFVLLKVGAYVAFGRKPQR